MVADLGTVLIFILMWLPKRETYVCSIMGKKTTSYYSSFLDEQGHSGTLTAKQVEKHNYTKAQIYSLENWKKK